MPDNETIEHIATALNIRPEVFIEYKIRRISDHLLENPETADDLYYQMAEES